ncbi:hypothetical protein EI94DRAFT_1811758 [Lactarius quietus]|nr:hypothetical protein EI94DRAFT_1811758 [Lactarius quietus]
MHALSLSDDVRSLSDRPLDVHRRLQAIAQGQSPATSHDRLSAVPARRAGLDEDPLNTPPLSLQPYKKRAVLQDFFLFSFSSVSVYSQLSLPEGALCATARAPDPSTFQATDSPMTRLSGESSDRTRPILPTQVSPYAVLNYTVSRTISREHLFELSILVLEWLENQLGGGPSYELRARRADEVRVQEGAHPSPFGVLSPSGLACPSGRKRIQRLLTLSKALCQRRQHFLLLHTIANQLGARLVDMSGHSVVVEVTGKTARVQAFLVLVKSDGVRFTSPTGNIPIPFCVHTADLYSRLSSAHPAFTNLKVYPSPLISSPTLIPPSDSTTCILSHGTPPKSPRPIDNSMSALD